MPPLIKGTRRESTEDINDVTPHVSDKSESIESDHPTNGTSHNSTVGVCEAPHPIDRIVWRNVAIMLYLHALGVYGIYLSCFSAQWKTVIAGEWPDLSQSTVVIADCCSSHLRIHSVHYGWLGHHSWCSSTVGSQIIQSSLPHEIDFDDFQLHRI